MTESASTADLAAEAPSVQETGWVFLRHLTSLFFPALSLAFVWTGPHAWYTAILFMAPMVVSFTLDTRPHYEQRQPAATLPAWPFDALVYLLAALQLLVVFELCRMFQHQAIFSVDSVMVLLLVGGSSGFSIITAHELIHRRSRGEQALGRLLLCTVLYEHFYTEHLRGHHVKVGLPEDPATARFGESYEGFFRRTVPAQFRSAWRLEAQRLGDAEMSLLDPRMLRNRILHGLALGWAMAFAAWAAFGFSAFVAFLLQAFMAVRLLEAVNYFEHWGLRRTRARVRPVDSWDTHSWFTYYGLTGLSRHADHHAWPSRPFQQLRVWDEAPLLPAGYVGSVDMAMARNAEFRHRATLELASRGLGPFDEAAEVDPDLREEAATAMRRARAFEAAVRAGAPADQAVLQVEKAEAAARPAPAGTLRRNW
ncbi:MAG: fatty acid desaturase, partial [Myxococcota bacterium]